MSEFKDYWPDAERMYANIQQTIENAGCFVSPPKKVSKGTELLEAAREIEKNSPLNKMRTSPWSLKKTSDSRKALKAGDPRVRNEDLSGSKIGPVRSGQLEAWKNSKNFYGAPDQENIYQNINNGEAKRYRSVSSDQKTGHILSEKFLENKINSSGTNSCSKLRRIKFYDLATESEVEESSDLRDDSCPLVKPQNLIVFDLPQREPVSIPRHLVGFPNNGNTCYLNSVLQAILALPVFTARMLDLRKALIAVQQEYLMFGNKMCLTKSLSDLVLLRESKMFIESSEVFKEMRVLKAMLGKINPLFEGDKMQDASEFLTIMLDCVDKDASYLLSLEKLPEFMNPVRNTFSIEKEETSRCLQCSEVGKNTTEDCCVICPLPTSTTQNTSSPIPGDADPRSACDEESDDDEFDYKTSVSKGIISPRIGGGLDSDPFVCRDLEKSQTKVSKLPQQLNLPKPLPASRKRSELSDRPLPDVQFGSPRLLNINKISSTPDKGSSSSKDVNDDYSALDLENLIKQTFCCEKIEKKCEKCKCEFAETSSRISSLPRVLVVLLSRYDKEGNKITRTVKIPKNLRIKELCKPDVKLPMESARKALEEDRRSDSKSKVCSVGDIQPLCHQPSTDSPIPTSTHSKWDKHINPVNTKVSQPAKPNVSSQSTASTPVKFKGKSMLEISELSEEDQIEYITFQSMKEKNIQDSEDKALEYAIKESLALSGTKRPYLGDPGTNSAKKRKTTEHPKHNLNPEDSEHERQRSSKLSSSSRRSLFKGTSLNNPEDNPVNMVNQLKSVRMQSQEEYELQQALKLSLLDNKPSSSQDDNEDDDIKYSLCSIISHCGSTPTSGHYTAEVYRYDEGAWFEYNDETVKPVRERERCTGNGYILMYMYSGDDDQK